MTKYKFYYMHKRFSKGTALQYENLNSDDEAIEYAMKHFNNCAYPDTHIRIKEVIYDGDDRWVATRLPMESWQWGFVYNSGIKAA